MIKQPAEPKLLNIQTYKLWAAVPDQPQTVLNHRWLTRKSPAGTATITKAVISITSIVSTTDAMPVVNSTRARRATKRAMAHMTESTGASITRRRARSIIGAMTLILRIAVLGLEARRIGSHLLIRPKIKRVEKLQCQPMAVK